MKSAIYALTLAILMLQLFAMFVYWLAYSGEFTTDIRLMVSAQTILGLVLVYLFEKGEEK